jgi:hypothetical protein
MLGLPEFFGGDTDPNTPYWGYYTKKFGEGMTIGIRHNFAETACYVGILPLLLALFALVRTTGKTNNRAGVLFAGGLGLLALLMALGTPVNALFYFLVPGFGQSGSPARVLVLWSLAVAILAAFGWDQLTHLKPTKREISITFGIFLVLFALGLNQATQMASSPPDNLIKMRLVPIPGEVFGRIGISWLRFALSMAASGFLFSPLLVRLLSSKKPNWGLVIAPALVALELFSVGINTNPTASPDQVYPKTPGISYLLERAGHERIFPTNKRWSLYTSPPAVLPPNGAMVFGLHDVQGYDSLLTGQFKAFANQFALPDATGTADASPQEVGNMVFAQNPAAPEAATTGASLVVSLPPGASGSAWAGFTDVGPVYASGDMTIFSMPVAQGRARLVHNQNGTPPEWLEDRVTRVTLKTTLTQPDTLLLADQFYPGWKADIDGTEAKIERPLPPQPVLFRAVALLEGQHTIAFRYDPSSIRTGIYLACFALMLLSAGTTFRLLKN